jgi:hypothetical protein
MYTGLTHEDSNLRIMIPVLTPIVQVCTTANHPSIVDDHKFAVDVAQLICQQSHRIGQCMRTSET